MQKMYHYKDTKNIKKKMRKAITGALQNGNA